MRLTIEKIMVLKQIPLFSEMPENAIADMLSLGKEIKINAGENVINEGEIVDGLYIVFQGKVGVYKQKEMISELDAHRYWGLLFAFDPSATRFTFVAEEDSLLFKIGGDGLYELISEYKDFAHNLIMTMCRRIKERDGGVFS